MPTTTARRLFRPITAGALALTASLAWGQTPPAATTDVGRIGTFKQVEGEVRVGKDGARTAPQSGDAVRAGQRITTGRDGAASMVLKDGTVLTLGPNTTTDLNQFQYDTTTQEGNFAVELLQGSLRVVTVLLAKVNPERFKVKTPTAVVGVRGTDFIVEATPKPEPIQFYLNHHWSDHSRLRR
jgi:ferric-dicitrate binding protein FerR (iron transport regulator)